MSHKQYPYNFLTNVIFAIYFPKTDLNNFTELKDSFKEEFPNYVEKKAKSFELKIKDFKQTSTTQTKEEVVSWQFSDKQKKNFLVVDNEKIVFETHEYTGFDEFCDNIGFIKEKFENVYQSDKLNRVGFRYINQIDISPPKDPLNWKDLINSDLTCLPDKFLNDSEYSNDNLSRSMHFLELNEEEYRLRFQFGLYNSEFPNPISKKEFILDYDCITIDQIEINDILDIAKKFNEIIFYWFELSMCRFSSEICTNRLPWTDNKS